MNKLVLSVLSLVMTLPMVGCKTNAQYDAAVAAATAAATIVVFAAGAAGAPSV